MGIYLVLRKMLQKQISYHPTPLPEQKLPFGGMAIYGALWGSFWINIHYSIFKFAPLGVRSFSFWVWIFTLVLVLLIIFKLAGRERLLPQVSIQNPVRKIVILLTVGLFSMTVGSFLTWAIWWHLWQDHLDKARKDVVAAGYSFDMPKNATHLPEKENSATYFK